MNANLVCMQEVPVSASMDPKDFLSFIRPNFLARNKTLIINGYATLNDSPHITTDKVMTNHSEMEINIFKNAVDRYAQELQDLLSILKPLAQQENAENDERITSSPMDETDEELIFNPQMGTEIEYIRGIGDDFLILVETLYYSGRHIDDRLIMLSNDAEERRKQFLSLCMEIMRDKNFEFGKEPKESNIHDKNAFAIYTHLSTAVALLHL